MLDKMGSGWHGAERQINNNVKGEDARISRLKARSYFFVVSLSGLSQHRYASNQCGGTCGNGPPENRGFVLVGCVFCLLRGSWILDPTPPPAQMGPTGPTQTNIMYVPSPRRRRGFGLCTRRELAPSAPLVNREHVCLEAKHRGVTIASSYYTCPLGF